MSDLTHWAIMQEPGAMAHANRERWNRQGFYTSSPRPKRAGTILIFDEGQKYALGQFVHVRYLESGNSHYVEHRFEWRSARSLTQRGWKPDDGADPGTRGREWSVVVRLRNGRQEHETRFLAWKED
jgi:hypothetical protein